jgi:NADH dehydrogenase
VFQAFEAAERETDGGARRAWLTFVVVGGGPTGVELAGALGELAHHTLKRDFRSFDPGEARVLLLEGMDRILPAYPPALSERAVASLCGLGVEVRTGVQVTNLREGEVSVKAGETQERLEARTVLWAAGMRASPLGGMLARRAGAELDRTGRVAVQPDLSLAGHPEVYVIGDLAHFAPEGEPPLPGLAPVAMQQGRFVADRIRKRGAARAPARFRYHDKGSLAVIGRNAAVGVIGKWRLSGPLAWLAWTFVHILYLVEFDNQALVLFQWAWSYFTRNRGARLITGPAEPDSPARAASDAPGETPDREPARV